MTIVTPPATHLPFGTAGCDSCHAPAGFTSFAGAAMNHTVVAGTACATCHETGKSFYGVTIVTRPTLAQDPNHPTDRRLRQLPRVDDVVHDRRHRDAGQPHPDHPAVRAVPHDARQLCGRDDEPRGHHQRMLRPATRAASASPTWSPCRRQRRTFRRSQACELCHSPAKFTNFSGGDDEPRWHHLGLRELPRHREEFLRRDDRHAAGHAHPDRRLRLRELPRCREIHQFRRHHDEPRAGLRHRLRNLPRGRQELLRRHHRHPADAGAGPESPADRRMRQLPQLDHFVHGRHHHAAGESHPDDAALRAVSHDARQLRGRHDEPHGHHQRMRDLPLPAA